MNKHIFYFSNFPIDYLISKNTQKIDEKEIHKIPMYSFKIIIFIIKKSQQLFFWKI